MQTWPRRIYLLSLLLPLLCGSGCSLFSRKPPPPPKPVLSVHDMLDAIRGAGEHEKSIIDVNPLEDPAVTALKDAARRDDQSGHHREAASTLDQALKLSPQSPDLLQDRAEAAVRLKDFSTAERLARQSWSLGPKLGPLCARNWQTVVEMRLQAGDPAGAAAARVAVKHCHKAGIPRY